MNKKQQGDVGVAMAIAYYTKIGYIVNVPLTDNSKYDLLVDIDGDINRVQCKCTNYIEKGKGGATVALRTSGGNQSWGGNVGRVTKENVEILFVYDMTKDQAYEFGPDIFDNKTNLTLGSKYDSYRV